MWRRLSGLVTGRRSKYAMLVFWLLLAVAVTPLALRIGEVQDNEALDALPGGAEAARTAQRISESFRQSDALVAVAVYAREGGLTGADRAKVEADRAAFTGYAEHGEIAPAVPSADGKALLLSFPLSGDDDAQSDASAKIKDRLPDGAPPGLKTALTGSAGGENDVMDAFSGMNGALLAATAATVALLLLITYRSPVLWLIPLLVVAVADQLASAAVYLLARYADLAVDFQSQNILTVLVFGVGVDYALLVIARYREELRRQPDRHAAMAVALRRCAPVVCASAATVALGLLCLLAADLPATRGLGPVGAVGIVATLFAMTTLLPAVLVLCGRWLFWPFVPRFSAEAAGHDVAEDHGVWRRLAGAVGRKPRTVWISSVAILAGLTFGIGNLSVGMPGDEAFTEEVGSITGQHMIEKHFPAGTVAPVDIVAAAPAADRVRAAAEKVDGVSGVRPAVLSADGRLAHVEAVLDTDPDARASLDTVDRLRDAVHAVPGGQALVGGQTAANLDTEQTTDRDNRLVVPLILAVIFLILVVLLRALVAPLLLLASVVVSFAAAMGAAGIVLDLMGHPRLWTGVPLQAFLFLVALGVDYTIFLMTRAREEVAGMGHKTGVLHALTVTGGVITSAGVVLAATFATLGVLPLVPSVQMGVIVAVGILLDTLLVRSLLVPALAIHVGPRVWWPGVPPSARTVRPA